MSGTHSQLGFPSQRIRSTLGFSVNSWALEAPVSWLQKWREENGLTGSSFAINAWKALNAPYVQNIKQMSYYYDYLMLKSAHIRKCDCTKCMWWKALATGYQTLQPLKGRHLCGLIFPPTTLQGNKHFLLTLRGRNRGTERWRNFSKFAFIKKRRRCSVVVQG